VDSDRFWLSFLAVCLLGGAGCKKREQYVGPPQEYYGVKVNWAKLSTEFTNASPDIQANVSLAVRAFRYALFTNALVELDKLVSNPNLTDAQKNLVNELLEQTKQVIAKAPPAPEQ
jgi:hypothetical protein